MRTYTDTGGDNDLFYGERVFEEESLRRINWSPVTVKVVRRPTSRHQVITAVWDITGKLTTHILN